MEVEDELVERRGVTEQEREDGSRRGRQSGEGARPTSEQMDGSSMNVGESMSQEEGRREEGRGRREKGGGKGVYEQPGRTQQEEEEIEQKREGGSGIEKTDEDDEEKKTVEQR
ncbi:hypothetical protein BZA77DRAFT_386252 [Pyronema omphalodes]|nr:hypothetical protein BZA77DRAFT_386252 [Pyronema omphalodes]